MADGEPFRGVAFNLSSLGYAISKGFKEILEPFELHPREFAVLRAVSVQEGQTQQALGDRLQIPRSRMVSILDELETRSLLERRPNPADRRVREIHLTEAGRRVLSEAFQRAVAYEQEVTAPLGPRSESSCSTCSSGSRTASASARGRTRRSASSPARKGKNHPCSHR